MILVKTKNGIIGFSSTSPEQYLKQSTVFVLHFANLNLYLQVNSHMETVGHVV